MQKELVISSISQETRVAVVEDGELVELLIERRRSQVIAGNIYKGRVTKVLPGMQSAFVDIGLERDAFLYVSDFLEDADEYERMAASAEDEALKDTAGRGNLRPRARGGDRDKDRARGGEGRGSGDQPADKPEINDSVPSSDRPVESDQRKSVPQDVAVPAALKPESGEEGGARSRGPRTRGRSEESSREPIGDRRSDRRGERKSRVPSFDASSEAGAAGPVPSRPVSVLPGESLAKYRDRDRSGIPPIPEESKPPSSDDPTALVTDTDADAPTESEGARTVESSAAVPEVESTEPAATDDNEPDVPVEAGVESEESTESGIGVTSSDEITTGPIDGGDEDAAAEKSQRVRLIDRGFEGAFTRKAPSRRPRRRSPVRSDDDKPDSAGNTRTISDLLKEGQEILVQVSKEPLGKKGARITSHIALPGRYLVYMPTVNHIGVSRKIASEEERSRLRRIIGENREDLPGGFIVRTAAERRDEKEIIQDIRFLIELWKEIREKNERGPAPAVIHSDLGLVERVLRDQLSGEYKAIRLDSELEYTKVLDFVSKFQPSLVNRVRLHLKNTPIFEEYGLQQEVEKAMRSKVWLKSGGYIVVNQTEALVAIDVNTGKFVGKSNRLEDTIVRTNIDAVHEIVRQIRLRNLGGIIVVDFIDMEERKNRQRVMQALEEELEKDRSPSKILQFNDFGLVAITRKRTHASLERVLGTPCPRCMGAGYVKSIETVCYEIQQELGKILEHIEGGEVTVRVSPEVAKALKSAEFVDFTEMEEESRKDIRIQSDPMLHAERFDLYE